MKKQITLLSGLLLAAGAFAQVNANLPVGKVKPSNFTTFDGKVTNVNSGSVAKDDGDEIWASDFSTASDWTIGTSGQGTFIIGNNAHTQVASATNGLLNYMGISATTTFANGFAFFNGIQYLLAGNVAAQNTWIASPAFDITGINSVAISFDQRYRAFNSDVTYVEFSTDGGTTWATQQVNVTVPTNGASVQNNVSVEFSANGATSGMVRFRWSSPSGTPNYGSGYGWIVDDVKINETYDDNMRMIDAVSVIGSSGLHLSKIPVTQVSSDMEIVFGSNVKNVGYNDQDAVINVSTTGYNQNGDTVAIAALASDSLELSVDGYPVPATVGVIPPFVVKVLASGATLDVTTDDSMTIPLEVTPSIMAVDAYDGTPASISGSFESFSTAPTTGITGLGTQYQIYEDGEVGAFEVGIGRVPVADQPDYLEREFHVSYYFWNGAEWEFAGRTQEKELVAANFGSTVKFYLTSPIAVTQDQVMLVIAASYIGQEVPVALSGYGPAGTTVGINGDDEEDPEDLIGLGSDDAPAGMTDAPIVRIDFKSYVGLTELEDATDLSVAPNPFTDASNINFTLKSDAKVSVVVTDLTGRVVMTVPATQMSAGAQSISIDGSSFKAGVYNYTLKIGNNATTKRVVKK